MAESIKQNIYKNIKQNYIQRLERTNLKVSKFKFDGVNEKDLGFLIEDRSFLREVKNGSEFLMLDDPDKAKIVAEISQWIHDDLRPKTVDTGFKTEGSLEALLPCIDLESDGDMYLISSKTGWTSSVAFKAWEKLVPKQIREGVKILRTVRKYQPESLEKMTKIENSKEHDSEYYLVNSCVQPDWRYNDETPQLRDDFKEFFTALFTTDASRQYAIDWIYESVYGRNATYLVLNGRKGIGKNILALAMSKLVGVRNYTEAPRSALSKEFNTYLIDKRLVLMDEISFRENKEKDKLKSYLNTFQAVEGKGKDAKLIELHCSIVLSSNSDKDVNIEPDDRRFSVMDLTDVPLLESIGDKAIETLVEYIESDSFPSAFNNFLEQFKSDFYNPNRPYIGDTFKRLCISSLTVWQTAIYEAVMSKSRRIYVVEDLMRDDTMRLFPKRHGDYQNFMENFTVDGKTIGNYVKNHSIQKSEIIPTSNYVPKIQDDLE